MYSITYRGDDPNILAELRLIQEAISRLDNHTLLTVYNPPDKPREGRTVIADGTSWDPVSTGVPTPVIFLNGTWTQFTGTGPQGPPGPPGNDGADGADGADGTDGSVWFDGDGAPTPTVPVGAVLGDFYLDNLTGDYYEVTAEGPIVWTLRGNLLGPTGLTGADGITPVVGVITNDAHVVAAAPDGTGYSLAAAGGSFRVFEGLTDVTGSSTFSIVGGATKNGLTISIDAAGLYTLSGASWTTDQESFIVRADYLGLLIDKDYTIAKSREGQEGNVGAPGAPGDDAIIAFLTNESHVVAAASDGTGYSLGAAGGILRIFEGTTEVTNSSTFSIIGGATKNGLTISVNPTNGTYTLSGASWTSDLEVFTIRGTYNAIPIDKDYTIAKARAGTDGSQGPPGSDGADGADAILGFLTNQTHVVAANNDGTGYSLAGAGGTFEVFEGTVEVTTSATFSVVGGTTKNGLTMSIGATTGIYTLSGGSWTSDTEVFTLQADYGGVTIIRDYTIAKSREGVQGNTGDTGAQGPPGNDGADGADTILGLLTNETHVVAAANDGTGYSLTGAGGTFQVFEGITDVTGSPTYSVVAPATKNGLTIGINASGVYTLSGASWTSDQEFFTVRAVYSGVTIDKEYVIAKSRQGANGANGADGENPIIGFLTNESHVVSAANDGTGYNLTGSGGTFQVFDGLTDVTGSPAYSVLAPATVDGLTMSITGAGVYSLSGASWSGNGATFTLRAVFSGVTIDKVYTIAKALGGSPGSTAAVQLQGATLSDFQISAVARCGYQLTTESGLEQSFEAGAAFSTIDDWLLIGNTDDYECRLDWTGDTFTGASSAINTWLPLTLSRVWRYDTSATPQVLSGSGTVRIRHIVTQTEKASAALVMSAESDI